MLTGRVSPLSGQVHVGSQPMLPQKLASIVGYVPLTNGLYEDDTFREALEFAAAVALASSSKPSKPHIDLAKGAIGNQGEQRIGIPMLLVSLLRLDAALTSPQYGSMQACLKKTFTDWQAEGATSFLSGCKRGDSAQGWDGVESMISTSF